MLVLNRHFQPVRITTAKQAFLLFFLGRARALDAAYEALSFEEWQALPPSAETESIGTPRGPIRVPRVLLLSGYARIPSAPLRLSRRNVFLRDNFTCQYCAAQPAVRELNLDHVVPRARGGKSTWDNLVTSCRTCNMKKGEKSPEAAGMVLRTPPRRPSWNVALRMAAPSAPFPEWQPFLEERDATRVAVEHRE